MENSKMEDQIFRNFKFQTLFLKVLPNAVLLRYRSLETVHGARRTKQKKILNFDMAHIAVHEEENKENQPCRSSKSCFVSFSELREPILEHGSAKEQRLEVLSEKLNEF